MPARNIRYTHYTKLTEFFCGCVRDTIDNFHLCPTHRAVKTRVEEIRTKRPPAFRIPPEPPFRNTAANSLHISTTANAPRTDPWVIDEEYGLCYACLYDSEIATDTMNGACGCPDEDCPYRWCGRTTGRHALYRAHVSRDYGRLTPSNPEELPFVEDQYLNEEYENLPEDLKAFLDQEKQWLEANTDRLARLLQQERTLGHWKHPLTWLQWLPSYPRDLRRELCHLICLGLLHPSPNPPNQLNLPMPGFRRDAINFAKAIPTPTPQIHMQRQDCQQERD